MVTREELTWFLNHHVELSDEEQDALHQRMHDAAQGSPEWIEARNELVAGFYKIVVKVARKYAGRQSPLEDLIQEGVTGLMRACDKFEPSRGIKFLTYAYWWIVQRMQCYRRDQFTMHSHRKNDLALIRSVARESVALSHRLGRTPTDAELSDSTGVGEWEIRFLRSLTHDFRFEFRRNGGPEFGNIFLSKDAARSTVDDDVLVRRLKAVCTERELDILASRLGLFNQEQQTLEEIAPRLGISRERVRQIESNALLSVARVISSWGYVTEPADIERLNRLAREARNKDHKTGERLLRQLRSESKV